MHTGSFLFSSLTAWRPLGYLLLFFGMMIEGDVLLFTAGFLTNQGFFDPGDMFIAVFSGALIGDLLWYGLGRVLNGSSSFIARWAKRVTAPFDVHLRERPLRAIFFSKFAYGLHHPILMRSGMLNMPVSDFVRRDVAATAPWLAIVAGLGYLSSVSYWAFRRDLKFVEIAFAAGILAFFTFEYFIRRRSRRKL